MYKEFWNEFFFYICCSHPCFTEKKSSSKDYISMVPKMLAINLFHQISPFFWERERFLYENFFCPFYSPILPFHLDSSKARIKNCMNKTKGHLTWCTMKCDLCLPCMLCKFNYSKHGEGLSLSSAWTWGLYPTNLKSFPSGVSPQKICIQSLR